MCWGGRGAILVVTSCSVGSSRDFWSLRVLGSIPETPSAGSEPAGIEATRPLGPRAPAPGAEFELGGGAPRPEHPASHGAHQDGVMSPRWWVSFPRCPGRPVPSLLEVLDFPGEVPASRAPLSRLLRLRLAVRWWRQARSRDQQTGRPPPRFSALGRLPRRPDLLYRLHLSHPGATPADTCWPP